MRHSRDGRWVQDINITGDLNHQFVQQFVLLWDRICTVNLNPAASDEIIWKLTPDDTYSANSAYKVQFFSFVSTEFNQLIWKSSAPLKPNSSDGSPFRTVYGPRTDSMREVGLTTAFVLSVHKHRNRPYTFSPSADTPDECGMI